MLRPALLVLAILAQLILPGCRDRGEDLADPDTALVAGTNVLHLQVDGRTRTLLVYLPPDAVRQEPLPLVYALHGRFGTGADSQSLYGFDTFAAADGWAVVYPDGVQKSWNDGRGVTTADTLDVDDIAFFDAMQTALEAKLSVDRERVFVCGLSNGGFMAQRLALARPERFAAVASVAGTLAESLAGTPQSLPLPMLHIHGEADTLIPYDGEDGILAVDTLEARWLAANGIPVPGPEEAMPNGAADGCTPFRRASSGGHALVERIRVVGGGHTWPGRPASFNVGKVCMDFDASALIWRFFADSDLPIHNL